jgi:hypothetical protein
MRHFLVAALLLVAAPAAADPKAITAAVKTNLTELGKLSDDDKLALANDPVVITERGTTVNMTERDGCVSGAVANSMYGCLQVDIKHLPGTVSAGSDGDVGWFQAPFTAVMTGDDPDGNAINSKAAKRIGGIAIKEGKTWKLAAVQYVETIPDKVLFKRIERDLPKGDPKLTGDQKLASTVAGWFKSGFAGNASTKTPLVASGTAPAEYKTGAAATKLATTWDKLKIVPASIDAKVLANGKIGWVTADVRLPRKSGKSVAMRVAIVVIPDGDGWRWVSIMYQPPTFIG